MPSSALRRHPTRPAWPLLDGRSGGLDEVAALSDFMTSETAGLLSSEERARLKGAIRKPLRVPPTPIHASDFTSILKAAKRTKSPGPDQLKPFLYQQGDLLNGDRRIASLMARLSARISTGDFSPAWGAVFGSGALSTPYKNAKHLATQVRPIVTAQCRG